MLLVELADRVLTAFPEKLSHRAERALEQLGVTAMLGYARGRHRRRRRDARARATTRSDPAPARSIWAAGVQASTLAATLGEPTGAELDRTGRVTVEPDLTLPGHPEVIALGDMVRVADATARPSSCPGVAPVAMQQGRYAATLVQDRLAAGRPPPFHYLDKGNLATIGRAKAVADIHGLQLSGLIAWVAWLVVHLFYLIGFQNRLLVLIRWAVSFMTRGRGARLITQWSAERRVLARRVIAPAADLLRSAAARVCSPRSSRRRWCRRFGPRAGRDGASASRVADRRGPSASPRARSGSGDWTSMPVRPRDPQPRRRARRRRARRRGGRRLSTAGPRSAGLGSHLLHDAGDRAAPTPLLWPAAPARQLGRRRQLAGTAALALASAAVARAQRRRRRARRTRAALLARVTAAQQLAGEQREPDRDHQLDRAAAAERRLAVLALAHVHRHLDQPQLRVGDAHERLHLGRLADVRDRRAARARPG